MDVQDKRDSRWSSMSDDELAAAEADYRRQADYGNNNGCREYLTAVIIERCIRDLANVQDAATRWAAA